MAVTRIEPKFRNKKLFCFGYGYVCQRLAARLRAYDWAVSGTTTDTDKKETMLENGIDAHLFDASHPLVDPASTLRDVTHIVLSVPPANEGDIVFDLHGMDITEMPSLEWIGYLSTTAVYGNRDGKWVDETSEPAPTSKRGSLRLKAEMQWRSLFAHNALPVHFFRLAGIYGPGRSAIDAVRAGTSRRINKPGHAFNRIHVDDVVETLVASINAPRPGEAYNLADDNPVPSYEVIELACRLLDLPVPPLIPFDQTTMAPMVRSFYTDNKRITNTKIKDALGVNLLYPDYKSGLVSCLEADSKILVNGH